MGKAPRREARLKRQASTKRLPRQRRPPRSTGANVQGKKKKEEQAAKAKAAAEKAVKKAKRWAKKAKESKVKATKKEKAAKAKAKEAKRKKVAKQKGTNFQTGKVCNSRSGGICHGYNLKCWRHASNTLAKCKQDKACCTSAIANKSKCPGKWARARGWVGYNVCPTKKH